MQNRLYLLANSLGSDEDLPPRTQSLLQKAEFIIGEEARETASLLKRLGISKSFSLLNEHTTEEELQTLALELKKFSISCILSDAGNPGIEDPASRLVPLAWKLGVQVFSLPAPSALLSALAASGFATSPFSFLGFLPRSPEERKTVLLSLKNREETLVFYETPYRIGAVISSLAEVWEKERWVYLSLGIGLPNETYYRGILANLVDSWKKPPKLPPVFVLEGKKKGKNLTNPPLYWRKSHEPKTGNRKGRGTLR